MSVQSEITRLSDNVTAALAAIAEKGVTVGSDANSDDLATLIAAIEAGGGDEEITSVKGRITFAETTQEITITHDLGKIPKCVFLTRNASISSYTSLSNSHYAYSVHTATATKNQPAVMSFGDLGFSLWAYQQYSGSTCSFGLQSQANTDGVIGVVVTQADESTVTINSPYGVFTAQSYWWEVRG